MSEKKPRAARNGKKLDERAKKANGTKCVWTKTASSCSRDGSDASPERASDTTHCGRTTGGRETACHVSFIARSSSSYRTAIQSTVYRQLLPALDNFISRRRLIRARVRARTDAATHAALPANCILPVTSRTARDAWPTDRCGSHPLGDCARGR